MEINIAGAGAGKTTKMSDKIILLRNQIDAEKKIFCVAFTNSAVDCMFESDDIEGGENL